MLDFKVRFFNLFIFLLVPLDKHDKLVILFIIKLYYRSNVFIVGYSRHCKSCCKTDFK